MQKENLEKYLDKDKKKTLRRELIARKFMARKPDVTAYWKIDSEITSGEK